MEKDKKSQISRDYVFQKVKNIVDSYHKEETKKNVRNYHKNVNFACPYCGDSKTNPYRYRGYVWLNSLMFTCFNCGTKKSFIKFCEDFSEDIEIEDKIQIYNHIDNNSFSNQDITPTALNKLIDFDEWVNFMNNKNNSWLTNIEPVKPGSAVHNYLILNRYIHDFTGIYQALFRKIRDKKVVWQTPVMINLNVSKSNNKLLGIQLRNLKSNDKRFFKIVEFEELYNYMYPKNPIDEYEAIPYNKASHFYNILNVNFEREVTIFEGFIDSKFFPNSIGLVGLNNDYDLINFLTQAEEDLNLRFFYDNDVDGNRKAAKLLDEGYSVFLWKKMIDEISKKYKNSLKLEKMLNQQKDLNDLVKFFKDSDVYKNLELEKYFSQDEFDKMFINKGVNFF